MMKKLFIIMAVAAALAVNKADAQRVQLGVRAGVSSQDLNFKLNKIGDESFLTDANLGFHAAVVSRIRVSRDSFVSFWVQPEIVYTQSRERLKVGESPSAKISLRSIDVPVLLSAKCLLVRLYAGPVFNAMYRTPSNRSSTSLNSIKPLMGYSVGGSVDIVKGFVFDVRFYGNFKRLKNSIQHDGVTVDNVKATLNSWSAGVSWLF